MSANSKIEWTESTWNPTTGCTIVSPGCAHCYAMRMAARLQAMGQKKYAGTTKDIISPTAGRIPVWTGKINLDDAALMIPLKRKKPTVYFVDSMSDLFHEGVPFEFIDKVFAVMALCPQHTFQVLTKRPERMAEYLGRANGARYQIDVLKAAHQFQGMVSGGWMYPLPNVWLGTSVEDQERADERIPHLLKCPAAVRFLSVEPMLGPVDLHLGSMETVDGESGYRRDGINWVIVGGESGPGARRFDIGWARSIIAQCKAAGVACFVKQLGARPIAEGPYNIRQKGISDSKGGDPSEWPEDLRIRQFPRTELAVDRATHETHGG